MVRAQVRREQALYAVERGLSLRRACALVGTPRSSVRYVERRPLRDLVPREVLRRLAVEQPRAGHRQLAETLRRRGFPMNHKRAHRLCRLEGLLLPRRRPRRRFVRVKPRELHHGAPNVVWACDFVHDRTADGRSFRCLTVIDEGTRECLAIPVAARLRSADVIATLQALIEERGRPRFLRTDNGSEFTAFETQEWLRERRIEPIFNEPGSPWQNGVNESFNGRFRAECLDAELFSSILEARVVIEGWRRFFNDERPHSSLGYSTPTERRMEYLQSSNEAERLTQ